MVRHHDDVDPRGVALSRVDGVGLGASSTVREMSGPPVSPERARMPRAHGATDCERAVRAAWNAGRATADVEPESLENAAVDFVGGFLLAFEKPIVEDWMWERFGVALDIPQETYADFGVFLSDLLYHRYLQN